MRKHLSVALSLVLFSGAVLSALTQQDKRTALKVAQTHAMTLHCEGEDPDDLSKVYATDDETFFVLLHVDYGCAGGSGTVGYVLTQVDKLPRGQFRVTQADVFDSIQDPDFSPRFISTVEGPTLNPAKGLLSFIGYSHDEDDANNFPSKKFRFVLDLSGGRLVDKSYLGKTDD